MFTDRPSGDARLRLRGPRGYEPLGPSTAHRTSLDARMAECVLNVSDVCASFELVRGPDAKMNLIGNRGKLRYRVACGDNSSGDTIGSPG